MEIGRSENENDPCYHVKKFLRIFLLHACLPAKICGTELFRHNWHNILKDGCRDIFIQSIVNGSFIIFSFQRLMSSRAYCLGLFFCCSAVDCAFRALHFIVLLFVFVNGVGMGMIVWSYGNPIGMGTKLRPRLGNGNGKDLASVVSAWFAGRLKHTAITSSL